MRRNSLYLLLLILFAFGYTGCDPCKDINCNDNNPCTADDCEDGECVFTPITCPDTASFVLDIKAMHGTDPFVIGQTYQNAQDYQFKISLFRFYFSHLILTKSDGTEVEVKDIEYLNFEDHHNTSMAEGEQVSGIIPAGDYTSMRFAIGVDSSLNFGDPSAYPSSHPLSVYKGSHWNWNSGYIFLKLEGGVDTIPNGSGTLDGDFLYHTGTVPLYREIQFDDDFTVSANDTFQYRLKMDVDRFFYSNTDTLDVVHDNFSHTMGTFDLAERVTNFVAASFSKR